MAKASTSITSEQTEEDTTLWVVSEFVSKEYSKGMDWLLPSLRGEVLRGQEQFVICGGPTGRVNRQSPEAATTIGFQHFVARREHHVGLVDDVACESIDYAEADKRVLAWLEREIQESMLACIYRQWEAYRYSVPETPYGGPGLSEVPNPIYRTRQRRIPITPEHTWPTRFGGPVQLSDGLSDNRGHAKRDQGRDIRPGWLPTRDEYQRRQARAADKPRWQYEPDSWDMVRPGQSWDSCGYKARAKTLANGCSFPTYS